MNNPTKKELGIPWKVWDGYEYAGGGKDLCIGTEDYIANVANKAVEGHDQECTTKGCLICFDITKDQRDKADFIVHAANSHHDHVEALEKLACLGNGDYWGNSEGNVIAQKALGLNPRDIYGQRAPHAPQEAGRDDNGPDSHPTPINDNEATDNLCDGCAKREDCTIAVGRTVSCIKYKPELETGERK